MTVDTAIARLIAYVNHQGWSTLRLAHETGVAESTLRGWRDPGWSPRVATLRRLERIIPPDWVPENSIPNDHTGAKDAA